MKRIIIFVLIMVLGLSVVAVAAPSDEQLKDLKKYNIMVGDEDGNMRLDDAISRAEVTKMICTIYGLNLDTFANNVEPSKFPDVPDSHWAKNYINAMKDCGIVQGDEKGYFNPEKDITNEEIIKMLVTVIGYSAMAEQTGGYPMGYTRTAQKIGLTEGLKLNVETAAIRSDVAQMFAVALDIPIMVQTGWSADGSTSYLILDGSAGTKRETIRTRFFNAEEMASLTVVKEEDLGENTPMVVYTGEDEEYTQIVVYTGE